MAQEPASDKVVSLMPWDITVRSATQRKNASQLLERDDADQIIRAMSELEVYYAVKALGVDDAVPYLSVVKPDQIRALFDLDIWHGDRPAIEDLLVWLQGFREAGLERLQLAARSMDPELLADLMRRRLLVAVKPHEDDPEHELPEWLDEPPDDILPLIETPDRRFIIAARTHDASDEAFGEAERLDEEDKKAILDLVDSLYRDTDHDFIAAALHAAASDLISDLEETCFRFRNARLEDLGFPAKERAIEIYGRVDAERVLTQSEDPQAPIANRLPAIHVEHLSQGFFEAALTALDSPELVHRIESELVSICNAALVADGVEPGDLVRIEEVLTRARGYFELALGQGSPANARLETAIDRLHSHSLRTLFRVGHSLTLRLKSRARLLRERAVFGPQGRRLEESDRGLLIGLTRARPLYSMATEGGEPTDLRPFSSPEQLEAAEKKLMQIETMALVAEAFRMDRALEELPDSVLPPRAEWTFDLLLTTLAAGLILEAALFGPVSKDDLARLGARLQDGAFQSADIERALSKIAEKTPGIEVDRIRPRVSAGLAVLAESLGPMVPTKIDLRFVEGVLRGL